MFSCARDNNGREPKDRQIRRVFSSKSFGRIAEHRMQADIALPFRSDRICEILTSVADSRVSREKHFHFDLRLSQRGRVHSFPYPGSQLHLWMYLLLRAHDGHLRWLVA